MCSCHYIPECCVMFSGVKLSMGSFVLFLNSVKPFLYDFSLRKTYFKEQTTKNSA